MTGSDESPTRGEPIVRPARDPLFTGPADDPDRYELSGAGITGGEGTTWKAFYAGRLRSPLPVAVKLLHPPPNAAPGWPSSQDRRRWHDQATLLRFMKVEHVVHVHEVFLGPPPHARGDIATDSGVAAYVAMEWLDGPTLQQAVAGSAATAHTIRQRLGYVLDAATALASLASSTQSAGNPSLHRDVKPTNGIVTPDRGLVLIDISTLRLLDDGFDPTGMHTPEYTAPEVLAQPHLPRDQTSDVYALGALALFCLTGHDPAAGRDIDRAAVARREILAVAGQAGLDDPESFTAHIITALDDDPKRRPRDPVAWSHQAIELCKPTPRLDRRRWGVTGVIAIVAVGLAVAHPWTEASSPGAHRPTALSSTAASALPSTAASTPRDVPAGSALAGKITSPVTGSMVKQCAYLSGTAHLTAGETLILSMQNLSNNDRHLYAEVVFGWDHPSKLGTWQGAQFFGQLDDAAGQHYRVQLIAASLGAVRRNTNAPDFGDSLARAGIVLDSIDVTRVPGAGPHNCEGPP